MENKVQELEQRIIYLESLLKDVFTSKQVFTRDVDFRGRTVFRGDTGFYGVTPVDQPATIADPSGGGTQDSQARVAIEAIIDRLQELGLIA